jgi:hypothetical protein
MRKSPAYAREIIARRQGGERIGLLVVAAHDWKHGTWFAERSEVARVVVPPDVPFDQVRFDCAHALDVLLCGAGSTEEFNTLADALALSEPASIWAEYDDGIWRIEPSSMGWLAVEGPYPLPWLSRAISTHRAWCLLRGEGIYGRPVFAAARQAAFVSVFGDEAKTVMRDLFAARAGELLAEAA